MKSRTRELKEKIIWIKENTFPYYANARLLEMELRGREEIKKEVEKLIDEYFDKGKIVELRNKIKEL